MKILKEREFWLLILVLLINLGWRVWKYKDGYLIKYNPEYWQQRYLQSQWVNPNSNNTIGDDGLYAYAGWEYLYGRDPTTLNAETPPLGKYLIGLNIKIFSNQAIFGLISGICCLASFYFLNSYLFKDRFWALLPIVFFSFEPLFWQQLRAPFLDLLYLSFLLLTFLFFLKEKWIVSGVFLGLMMATKSSLTSFFLVVLSLGMWLLIKKQLVKKISWLSILPVSWIILMAVYFRHFLLGGNLISFLKVQKWIWNFYAEGAKAKVGSVWPMIFLGKWPVWWTKEFLKVGEWQITWPILTIFNFQFSIFSLLKRNFDGFFLLVVWGVIYLLFLSFIPVWPRYLLLLLPFMYNNAVWELKSIKKK